MPRTKDKGGSISKEFPISAIDQSILAIHPNMPYSELRTYAQHEISVDITSILRQRFLLVENDIITYDLFLSLVHSEGIGTPRIRKIMYFLWCFRDFRVRRFICERIVSPNGRWSINELVNKANCDFFTEFFAYPTAVKTRSNIENFLAEIGILDRPNRQIHLELDDGWLADAMQVASQHERSAAHRRAMVNDPINFLVIPTTPLSLALRFPAFTMREIGLVIAPLDPRHKSEALFNRICMQGQHDLE